MREKIRAFTVFAAKILLIFEIAALAVFSFREYSYEREIKIPVYPDGYGTPDDEIRDGSDVYGVGFERGDGLLFWFHGSTESGSETAE